MGKKTTDTDKIDRLLRGTGADSHAADQLQKAAQNNPAVAKALNRLTDSDIAAITATLSDKEALARIMSTPKAQALLKKLKG